MKTYNQIIKIFESFANRHYQINSFFLGKNYDLENATSIHYPCLQVYPTSANMPQNDGGMFQIINLTFDIKIIDQLQNDETNTNDVSSDTLQIAQDLICELNNHPYFFKNQIKIEGDISLAPIDHYEDSNANGWEFTLQLKYLNNSCYLDLPIIPLIPPVSLVYQFEDDFEFDFEDGVKYEFEGEYKTY